MEPWNEIDMDPLEACNIYVCDPIISWDGEDIEYEEAGKRLAQEGWTMDYLLFHPILNDTVYTGYMRELTKSDALRVA